VKYLRLRCTRKYGFLFTSREFDICPYPVAGFVGLSKPAGRSDGEKDSWGFRESNTDHPAGRHITDWTNPVSVRNSILATK